MCHLCNVKPVYEFTNQRKLCKICYIKWFQKKVFFVVRKFKMIHRGDVICCQNKKTFRDVVMKYFLRLFEEKGIIKLINLRSLRDELSDSKFKQRIQTKQDLEQLKFQAKRGLNKTAVSSTLDSEAEQIINILIKGNVKDLKKLKPVDGNVIKPLYLFLDEEVLLYAKSKGLKFAKKTREKENKIKSFLVEFEKKHPEAKRAIVSSYLELCN